MKHITLLIFLLFLSLSTLSANACTIFTINANNDTYFGNNEDYIYDNTFISFKPGNETTYGIAILGYHNNNGFTGDNLPQGGFNTKGLAFDANALPSMPIESNNTGLKLPSGNILENVLMYCKNVAEVINWFQIHILNITEIAGQFHFADASGNATVISVNNGELAFTFINEMGYLVSTNYNLANVSIGQWPESRQYIAENMLENLTQKNLTQNITTDDLMQVLNATHQYEQPAYGYSDNTVYSYLVDLKSLDITIYYMHDFSKAITYNLPKELQKGTHIYDLGTIFASKSSINGFDLTPLLLLIGVTVVWKKKINGKK